MYPWRRTNPKTPGEKSEKRGRSGRPAEPQGTRSRSREIRQVPSSSPHPGSSTGPAELAGSQGPQEAGGVRRRQPSANSNAQPSRTPTRQRQISASFPNSASSGPSKSPANRGSGRRQQETVGAREHTTNDNVQSQRRPREISQVSAYSTPSSPPQPPQGRRAQNVGAYGRPQKNEFQPPRTPARPREISEPSLSSPYAQQRINPYQYPSGRRLEETRATSRQQSQSFDPLRPGRPREISKVSGNMPQRSKSPPNQYGKSTQRVRENRSTSVPYSYTSAPNPSYQQPTRPSQLTGGYGPYQLYVIDPWGRIVAYPIPGPDVYHPTSVKQPAVQYVDEPKVDESKLSFDYPPETFTGFTKLPFGKASLILLLWLPRLFIPWITAWYDFNVFILSNPWHWKARDDELLQQKIYMIVGRSIIAVLSSVFVDLIRKKCELEYYVYFVLLLLFNLSPLSGGYLDVLLRAQFVDVQVYKDRWFWSVILTQWTISVAFIMFPVQMACVYSQTSMMSRNAHYNWTSLFVLMEFINAYVAFLIIPSTCPTQDWTQIVVWAGIGLLLVTVTMLTLIFLFAVRALKYAMMMCWKRKTEDVLGGSEPGIFLDSPSELIWEKVIWFSMIAVPIISISFSVAVLERFVSYENWDYHHFSSTLSLFLFGKIIGVIMMAAVMIMIHKVYTKNRISTLKTEILYLGMPHVLCILALVTMVGRFTTLSHLKEGDIVVGPIPDKDKTVLVLVNSMFRNRTICIRSEYFQPVKIRPNQHVTRELYDIGVDNFTVTMEVDPCSSPAIRTRLQIENVKKGEWRVYDVVLLSTNFTESDTWDYYRTLYAYNLRDEGNLRPKVGPPQLVIFQVSSLAPKEYWYYQMNHSKLGSQAVPTNNSVWSNLGFSRNLILWVVPATGKWTVQLWSNLYNKSDVAYAWATNCTQCVSPLEFEVENNSLYLLVEYYYEEIVNFAFNISDFDNPPPDLQFPMYPLSYAIFKLGEVAGPNSDRLPDNEELQKDWAVKISLALAGMANGGIFLGFVYLFWVDPPVPRFRTVSLALCWVLMGFAAEIPRFTLTDIGVKVSIALLCLQIVMTVVHFIGAYFMHTPAYDFRIRPKSDGR